MKLYFRKYSALGNNFIITHSLNRIDEDTIIKMCDIKLGIGADGLILVKKNPYEMEYFNKDGSKAKICGNGLRCAIDYLKLKKNGSILVDGINYEYSVSKGLITVSLKKVKDIYSHKDQINHLGKVVNFEFVDMIVPHIVVIDDIEDKENLALAIRGLDKYKNANVNFYSKNKINTYENGVGFTSSCGTGSAAVAYVLEKDILVENSYGKMNVLVNKYIQLRSRVNFVFKGVYYV
ncbi:diaminopimelate epimerase [Mycoplasmatota bacterium]|nr:diaminopimelate epimerase [Mycoplasmatota bacterium]